MSEKIALVCDSMSDLPRNFAEEHSIKVLPARVIYPDREYADGIDIQPDEVYSRMPQEIPTTSMPSPHDIRTAFEELIQEGFTHCIALHISSALSGTYESVKMVADEIKNLRIQVIDSRTLSMGTGWLVINAARNIKAGWNFDSILENMQALQEKARVYYILDTLEYLRKGGRIGKVAGMIGEFLHLKPVISVNAEGEYFTYCKAKGRRKSIEKLVEIIEKAVQEREINLGVVHGGAPQEFELLVKRFKQFPNIREITASQITPVLGVHTGPGLLGVCFYEI
ncbi:MAG TPA: fatty acid-binding protein DegV [Syntrophomonas sp.]|jgi:DegV family protein with EDD domain|nr:fatty acid-binding protein DegV [Syntrophomonas sp.]